MKQYKIKWSILFFLFAISHLVLAQKVKLSTDHLEPNKVYLSLEKLAGKEVIKVIKDLTVSEVDEPTFVKIKDVDFKDGIIEVMVLSKLHKRARPSDRGFIGLAFRINDDLSKFECIYIRPTNGRSDDQIRRNHSTQYFSYPDYKFSRLRKETPEMYESYADMGLDEWIKMKIEVKGSQAKLFLNDQKQPCLVVNDLKLGPDASGALGLFVDVGTEGYFRDLKIIKK